VVDVANLKDQLSDLYDSVLSGETEPKVGAVAAQIANVRARLVETELKVRETEELERRMDEFETLIGRQNNGRDYGRI
jgi:hypothetical protein